MSGTVTSIAVISIIVMSDIVMSAIVMNAQVPEIDSLTFTVTPVSAEVCHLPQVVALAEIVNVMGVPWYHVRGNAADTHLHPII
jgi:hypothetical protein